MCADVKASSRVVGQTLRDPPSGRRSSGGPCPQCQLYGLKSHGQASRLVDAGSGTIAAPPLLKMICQSRPSSRMHSSTAASLGARVATMARPTGAVSRGGVRCGTPQGAFDVYSLLEADRQAPRRPVGHIVTDFAIELLETEGVSVVLSGTPASRRAYASATRFRTPRCCALRCRPGRARSVSVFRSRRPWRRPWSCSNAPCRRRSVRPR